MGIENAPKDNKLHSICIQNRKIAHLEGVTDVIRFDENEVLLETACGMLSIDGEGLRLSEWNTERGLATLEGRIDGIEYFDKKQEDAKAHNRLFGRTLK
ncbi:MAG: YabP/YqfC family sporulation protein [Clostridia bacterium]|nr:YabP/YqfC family sporulation protein [Clostridia bacterium]